MTRNEFRYANDAGTPDGLRRVVLKEGRARIRVNGMGVNLPLPSLPFVKDPRVVAQLNAANGLCWEATYSTATVNDQTMFKAKSD